LSLDVVNDVSIMKIDMIVVAIIVVIIINAIDTVTSS
jgi:hypothetical protein